MLHLEIDYFFVAIGMALVNCSVVNCTSNKTVLPWSILSAGESGITIQQFYDEKVVCKVHELNEMDLESAFLGKIQGISGQNRTIIVARFCYSPLWAFFVLLYLQSAPTIASNA